MAGTTDRIGTRAGGLGLIDNLRPDGVAFSLGLVHEMGHRSFSDKKATLSSGAVDNGEPCLDPPA